MENSDNKKSAIWKRLALVTVLLIVLVGPKFGPIPNFLGNQFSIEGAVIGLLISFIIGFLIITAVILRTSGGMTVKEWLTVWARV